MMYPEDPCDYWGGEPQFAHSFNPLSVSPLCKIPILVLICCKNLVFAQNSPAVLLYVCVCVCNPVLKALNVYSAFIPFFSLFSGLGQNWVKLLIFF